MLLKYFSGTFVAALVACLAIFPASIPAYANEELTIRTEFRIFPLDQPTNWETLFYFEEPGRLKEIRFFPGSRSLKYDYRGPQDLVFYRMVPNEEGEDIPVPAATVRLQRGARPLLLLFDPISNPRPGGPLFNIFSLRDDLDFFPANTTGFFNALGRPLLGVFGDQQIRLPAWEFAGPLEQPDIRDQEESRGILIGLVVRNDNNELERIFHTRWYFMTNTRTLIVLIPPREGESRIRVQRLIQRSDTLSVAGY